MKILRAQPKNLFDFLPENLLAKIAAAGSIKIFSDGQTIQERGDENTAFTYVKSGRAIAGTFGLDGSFIANALLYPGDSFGEICLFAGVPRTQTVWAEGEAEIVSTPEHKFMAIFDNHPEIGKALIALNLLRNSEAIAYMDALRRMSLPARIARLLLNSTEENAISVTVECRQEDLEFMLGVSRVSIGKALKRLQADGLLTLEYGKIHLLDIPALKERVNQEDQLRVME